VTAGGHLVAEARLGQVNGWRALRLVSAHAAPLPDLAEPAPRADDTPGPPALRETDSQKQAPPQAPRQDATPSPPANATAEEGADPP
jgi:hypothetical protein